MAVDRAERPCTVVLHDDRVSQDDVLCGTDILPEGKIGILSAKNARPIHVLSTKRAAAPREISLHVTLGERFLYENRMSATITVLNDTHEATANHVEFFFRDICLSRADMWQMTRSMDGGVVYGIKRSNSSDRTPPSLVPSTSTDKSLILRLSGSR